MTSLFKSYKKKDTLPKFLGMVHYFSAPFLLAQNEIGNWYYIVKVNRDSFYLCVYDPDSDESMGGEKYGDEYQADEYCYDTLDELMDVIKDCGFDDSELDYVYKKCLKRRKKLCQK